MNIERIMSPKVLTVEMDDTLTKIQRLFCDYNVHHVLVMEQGKLVGVISDRDYLKAVSPFINTICERTEDESTLNKRAHQIMTRKPITITRKTAVETAALLLLKYQVSCLPIVSKSGEIEGVITWRDLLKHYVAIHFHKQSGSVAKI